MSDDLLDEQVRYYRARADVYDDGYARRGRHDRGPEANARWLADLGDLVGALAAVDLGDEVLELGCGTGQWTVRLAAAARQVTALDAAPEMLAVAGERLAAAGVTNVALQCVDVIRSWEPDRLWDGIAAFFFVEHVPDEHLDGLVARIARALRPGGRVFVAEGLERGPAPGVEVRELHGQQYRVVERRRTAAELRDAFGAHGIDLEVGRTEHHFCHASGRLT